MMDEIIYSLLLTGRFGLSLPGTLRFHFTDLDALTRPVDVAAMLAAAPQPVTVEVAVFQLEGTLSVPLLTGLHPVPLQGVALGTAAGPIGVVLLSTDPARPADVRFNLLDLQTIAGGLVWRRGQFGELVLSLLGTQLPLGLQDEMLEQDQAAPQDETA
ncbi:hypothetical protein [Duganella sp. 1411]|uniref:hypothetical protein n=1 Tax=Duganella sp. 1411 TaxID=2806572 RepID=UPI001AEB7E0D|nr:hypothetical protein [Duganella sp. 1411]